MNLFKVKLCCREIINNPNSNIKKLLFLISILFLIPICYYLGSLLYNTNNYYNKDIVDHYVYLTELGGLVLLLCFTMCILLTYSFQYIKQNGFMKLLNNIFTIIKLSFYYTICIICSLIILFIIGHVIDMSFDITDNKPIDNNMVIEYIVGCTCAGLLSIIIIFVFVDICYGVYLSLKLIWNSCKEGIDTYNTVSTELNEIIISKTN